MNKPRLAPVKLLAATTITLLCSCSVETPTETTEVSTDTQLDVVANLVNFTIAPAIEDFDSQALGLLTSAQTFCANPTLTNLEASQTAWRETMEQWLRVANYVFGPLNDNLIFPQFTFIDSFRLRGTNYTATVRSDISADVNGTHTLDDAYYATKTFNRVGLLAIEVALFETVAGSPVAANILTEYQNTARKCEALLGLGLQLQQRSSTLQSAWATDYQNSGSNYQTLLSEDRLEDGSEALTLILTGIQEHLDHLQRRHFLINMAQLSDHAWPAVEATINHINALLEGDNNPADSDTIFSAMAQRGNAANVALVRANINAALDAIQQRNQTAFEDAAAALDGNFKREIPDGLNIDLGINFTDGD